MDVSKLVMVGLGFAAGIAFVVACPSPVEVSTSVADEVVPASAAPQPGCRQWQLQRFSLYAGFTMKEQRAFSNGEGTRDVPEEWEPFAFEPGASGGGTLLLRRCIK